MRFLTLNPIWSPEDGTGSAAASDASAASTGADVPATGVDGAAPAAGTTILTEKPSAAAEAPAEFKPDPAKTDEENAAAKAEHDAKAKPVEAKKEDKPNEFLGAPETYDIKTPEGFEVDPDVKTEFETVSKEIGLSQKGAERLVAIQTKLQEKQAERTAATIAGWAKDVKADKELGGNEYDAKMAVARESLAAFGDEQLGVLLDKTGIGNHPAMIRFMYRAGVAMGEGKVHRGAAATGKPDAASILYPNESKG